MRTLVFLVLILASVSICFSLPVESGSEEATDTVGLGSVYTQLGGVVLEGAVQKGSAPAVNAFKNLSLSVISESSFRRKAVLNFELTTAGLAVLRQCVSASTCGLHRVEWVIDEEGTPSFVQSSTDPSLGAFMAFALCTPCPRYTWSSKREATTLSPATVTLTTANGTTAANLSSGGRIELQNGIPFSWQLTQVFSFAYNSYLYPDTGTLTKQWKVDCKSGTIQELWITLHSPIFPENVELAFWRTK